MPLYQIQDSDRPMWVLAKDYGRAEYIFAKIVAEENEMPIDEVDPPLGVSFICGDSCLALDDEAHCLLKERIK